MVLSAVAEDADGGGVDTMVRMVFSRSPVTLPSLHIPVALLHRPVPCQPQPGQLQGIKVETNHICQFGAVAPSDGFFDIVCDNAFIINIINHVPPKE